ncbi:MAG: MDR family MFS transporter [Flavobacterium sp.]
MLRTAFHRYVNSFRGFSREIWILAVVTFINRAGTMVLPFLSKYLKEDLGFTYGQVGWIMVCFGLGSMLGSWLGGKLSDKVGFYRVMVFSLFTSGLMFFGLQFIKTFEGLCLAMFAIMTVADMFRPAMFVSLGVYAKPENRTRALTLVRLAVNLGFAAGPALGGLIIMGMGYHGLFWVDGASCIVAITLFFILVKERKRHHIEEEDVDGIPDRPIRQDTPFWIFLGSTFLLTLVFFQLFTTLPLYHKEHYGLTEFQTGLFLTLNGFLIFLLEMPIVNYMERKHVDKLKLVLWGSLCMGLGFFALLIDIWVGILVVNVLFLTFGEMFAFPFSNSFALSRASKKQVGTYMGYYTMSFSMAHIASSKTGMDVIDAFGYNTNWTLMGILGMVGVVLAWWSRQLVKREHR